MVTGGEVRNLSKRAGKAWSAKAQWQTLLNDAYRFALPQRNLYSGQGTSTGRETSPGNDKMVGVYDSTAPKALVKFANRLSADFTPPFRRWVKLSAGPFVPTELRDQVNRQLAVATEKFFGVLFTSNFDIAANEYYLELGIGTAAMLVQPGDDDNPVMFETAPSSTYALEEGPGGGVGAIFRRMTVQVQNIESTWRDAKLNDDHKRKLDNDPTCDVKLEEATYRDRQTGGYRYVVFERLDSGAQYSEKHVLVDRRYRTNPWVIARWLRVPGETLGRGPVLFALPDIRTANAVVALILKNASLAISGVWAAADDGVLNPYTITITPGAVIPVRNVNSIKPLEFGGRFDVGQLVLEDMRMSIKEALFDSTLPPETAQPRTATEIIERIKQLQQDHSAPFSRLMVEFIQPLVARVMDVLAEKRLLATPIKVNGLTVRLQAVSPLAQAQNLADVESAVQWAQVVRSIAPEAFMLGANIEAFPSWLADKLGVDQQLVRTPEEVMKMQQMAGAAVAQQGQQAQAIGAAAGGGAPAPVQPVQPGAMGIAA